MLKHELYVAIIKNRKIADSNNFVYPKEIKEIQEDLLDQLKKQGGFCGQIS